MRLRHWRAAILASGLSAVSLVHGADPPPGAETVVALLHQLDGSGIDILYSSELVPHSLLVPDDLTSTDPLERVTAALARARLQLRRVGERRYIIARAPPPPRIPPTPAPGSALPAATEPLEEISIFASQYGVKFAANNEAIEIDHRKLGVIAGAQSDAVRAVRTTPGLASNLSAQPFVRGALRNDVMVRFDGVEALDPFHLKNFQSLLSLFDPFAIGRVDIYTGGFPVRFGTRSAGVIDLSPRSIASGQEYQLGTSLLSTNFALIGRARNRPLEWLATVRRSSSSDIVQPIDGERGRPQFYDALGRIRWITGAASALTAGWLLLDDSARLSSDTGDESVAVKSRDISGWFRLDYGPVPALSSSTTLAFTNSERTRQGFANLAGVVSGTLDDRRDFTQLSLRSEWTYAARTDLSWSFGAELAADNASLEFAKQYQFAAPIASAFAVPADGAVTSNQAPHSFTRAVYAAARHHWRYFEVEAGGRVDQQGYRGFGTRTQYAPRFNLRVDPAVGWHLYSSWGTFAQAQRVDEFRAEENQILPDPGGRAIHLIAGLSRQASAATSWRIEAYRNRWSKLSPYFDNSLDATSLLPELEPDRVRIAPSGAEASGIELSAQHAFGAHASVWGGYTVAHAFDDLGGVDVPRSWDQRAAASFGAAWSRHGTSVSMLLGWHSGWPRTLVTLAPATSSNPGNLVPGIRNAVRWQEYLSADLRITQRILLRQSTLSLWLDATNATNRGNQCCADLETPITAGGPVLAESRNWQSRIVNVGFTLQFSRDQ